MLIEPTYQLRWCRVRVGLVSLLALTGLLVPPAASSQEPTAVPVPVMVGARVRLWERVASSLTTPVVGSLTWVTADSVSLRADGLGTPVTLARPTISRVDVSGGRGSGSVSSSAWRGAIVGALGGAVLGTIAGSLTKRNAAKLAAAGFVVGGGLGAGVGAAQPGEAWRRAELPASGPPPP